MAAQWLPIWSRETQRRNRRPRTAGDDGDRDEILIPSGGGLVETCDTVCSVFDGSSSIRRVVDGTAALDALIKML